MGALTEQESVMHEAIETAFGLIDKYMGDTDPRDPEHLLILACQALAPYCGDTPSAPLSGAVESDAEVAEIETDNERRCKVEMDATSDAHLARTQIYTLLRKLRALDGELAKIRGIQFSPTGDNHHNALLCPYCNPNKLELRQAPAAQMVATDGFTYFLACAGYPYYRDRPDLYEKDVKDPETAAGKAARVISEAVSSGVVKQMPTRDVVANALADAEFVIGAFPLTSHFDGADAILALFRAPDEVKR